MIRIDTWISPGNVDLTGGQIENQGIDGLAVIQRGSFYNGMIADRIREIDMVFLDGLQGFDRMVGCTFDLSESPKIPDA